MPPAATLRLNDPGANATAERTFAADPQELRARGVVRIIRGGALHHSQRQQTGHHASFAWKAHLGVDAPVWVETAAGRVEAQVILVPPNLPHATGARGESIALFVAPGVAEAPWPDSTSTEHSREHSRDPARELYLWDGALGRELGRRAERLSDPAELRAELVARLLPRGGPRPDGRVRTCLAILAADPDRPLPALAAELELSLDRLSRLVSRQTGLRLRRHVLWSRTLRAMSARPAPGALSHVAHQAGFADHAHMTRTFRALLGKTPAELAGPPEVLAPWNPTPRP